MPEDQHVDAIVIGAGMAGLGTADELRRQGRSVVVLAATFTRRSTRGVTPTRPHGRDLESMVFESATVFPTPEGAQLTSPPPAVHLRLPEAVQRVLREGSLAAVRAALHDPAAVQLRGNRRAARPPRRRGHERQREAGHEPRRAGSRPEGAARPGPAAHPGRWRARSATTRTAGTWRMASGSPWNRRRLSTRTSTCPPRSAPPCSSSQKPSGARSRASDRSRT